MAENVVSEGMRMIYEIGALLIGVAVLALLIGYSSNTSQLIATGGSTFGGLLSTVELQGQPFGGMNNFGMMNMGMMNNYGALMPPIA